MEEQYQESIPHLERMVVYWATQKDIAERSLNYAQAQLDLFSAALAKHVRVKEG